LGLKQERAVGLPIEATSLWDLNFGAETFKQVFIDDTVGGGEEGQDVRDEVPLIVIQTVVPIVKILGQIDFLSCPE